MAKATVAAVNTNENTNAGLLMVTLMPEAVVRDDDINVRPWSTNHATDADERAMAELEASIEAEGQVEPIVVRAIQANGGAPEYHLIAGGRRTQAVFNINVRREADGKEPLALTAVVKEGVDDETAFRIAAMENIHRQNLSPVEMAELVRVIRENFGWTGGKNTKKVAEYLKVSAATVTQHEKLLTLPEDVQRKVHEGVLSAAAAFEIKDVPEEDRAGVIEEAERRQAQEKAVAGEAEAEAEVNAGSAGSAGKGKKRVRQGKTAGAVKAKHIRSVARDRGLSKKPLDRGEIVAGVAALSEVCGGSGNPAAVFVRSFGVWVSGMLTTETFKKNFAGLCTAAGVEKPKSGKEIADEQVKKNFTESKKKKAVGGGKKTAAKSATPRKPAPKPKK